MTRERWMILEQVLSERGHFDADDLLAHLRRAGRTVSRATLYRSLAHLVDSGLVHRLEMAQGQARYEAMFGRHHHDHMICLDCGRILEFESREVERIQTEVCRRKRFVMTGHTHQIRGYCQECASKSGGAAFRDAKAPGRAAAGR